MNFETLFAIFRPKLTIHVIHDTGNIPCKTEAQGTSDIAQYSIITFKSIRFLYTVSNAFQSQNQILSHLNPIPFLPYSLSISLNKPCTPPTLNSIPLCSPLANPSTILSKLILLKL